MGFFIVDLPHEGGLCGVEEEAAPAEAERGRHGVDERRERQRDERDQRLGV